MPFELRCYYSVFVSAIFELNSFSSYQMMLNKCNQLLTRIFGGWEPPLIIYATEQCATGTYILFTTLIEAVPLLHIAWMIEQGCFSFTSKQKEETGRFNMELSNSIVLSAALHTRINKKAWSQYYMYVGTRVTTCLISGLGPSIQHH